MRKPASSRSSSPIFSVGGRAFVNSPGGREDRITVVGEREGFVQGELIDGAEVEILGWLPRGTATRYHVRSTHNGIEGWVGVGQLRATRALRSPEALAKAAPERAWIAPRAPGPTVKRPRTATPAPTAGAEPHPKGKARAKTSRSR